MQDRPHQQAADEQAEDEPESLVRLGQVVPDPAVRLGDRIVLLLAVNSPQLKCEDSNEDDEPENQIHSPNLSERRVLTGWVYRLSSGVG